VEVGPIIARAAGRRSGQAVGLPALAALLLASVSIAFSITLSAAVFTADRPAAAAVSGPDAVPAPATTHGSVDLDVLSGYLRATPATGSDGVSGVTAGVTGTPAPGADRHQQGRAPPHAR
jgi:hypothetical protein